MKKKNAGFEQFAVNDFEQFCINLANEKLQQHFNAHGFKQEQAEYVREGIDWSYIEFVDNQDVLDLVEKRPGGVIDSLDEACRFPRSTAAEFVDKLCSSKVVSDSPRFARARRLPNGFTVEHYAGAVLDANGQHMHHLVLMAQRPADKLNWQAAMDWASRIGGALPIRQEQALLLANCKPHLEGVYHWSCEEYEGDASYAWLQGFDYGTQNDDHIYGQGRAVAVRRLPI